jgi:Condensation domain
MLNQDLNRYLGPFEHLLWSASLWAPRHFAVAARIEGRILSSEALTNALRRVQRRHPALRATIGTADCGRPRFTATGAPIALSVVERVDDQSWKREAEGQLALPFTAACDPLLRAVLVQGETVSDLILAVHHSIGDGVSAVYFVRDLLWALEGRPLQPLLPQPSCEHLAGSLSAVPPAPSKGTARETRLDLPDRPVLNSFEMAPQEAQALATRCRQCGTTIQGALLAALLLSGSGEGEIRCLAPLSVRPLLPAIQEDFGLYITSGLAVLDRNQPAAFWEVAKTAREQLLRALDRRLLQARAAGITALAAGNPAPKAAYEMFRRLANYQVVLSNLGTFPASAGESDFGVTAFRLMLNAELEPVLGVTTAGGRLCVALTSNWASDAGWIRRALDRLRSEISVLST